MIINKTFIPFRIPKAPPVLKTNPKRYLLAWSRTINPKINHHIENL